MKRRRIVLSLMILILLLSAFPFTAQAQTNCYSYVIRRGDTLFRIAVNNGTTVGALAQLNGIADPTRIYAGDVIVVCPGVKAGSTITINVQVTTSTQPTVPNTPTTSTTTTASSGANPNILLIKPFEPCPFIANGVFSDCGSYWLELAAGYPVAFFATCIPKTVIANPIGGGFLQCALTGDRYLRLPMGTVNSTLP